MPFLPLLLGLAPTVASWIMGDKTGAAVTKITGIARDLLGTDDSTGMERAIAADPNLALQFKMAIIQAEADARAQEFATLRAQLVDVQSARDQTVKLAQAGSAIAWGAPIVSVLAILVFAGFVYLLFAHDVPEKIKDPLMLLAGSAASGFGMVLSYWLGSSAGSASKNDTIKALSR